MRLKIYLFAVSICLSVSFSSTPVQARFFPNISSIPPWLIPNQTIISGAWDAFNKFHGCHRGDKTDGLSNLKHYFNNFGYLSIADKSNFTDDFDDALELALKTYQKNFNLNVTGELDQQTLNYIVKPRCGNPDIVNGTTTMNSGKPESTNATRQHFHSVQHYTFFPGQPVWPDNKRELTYAFQPENELSDNVKSVFSRAFEKWATVTPLTFTETASFYTADIKIGFFVGDHGDGEPFDGVLGTLAHAFSPPSGRFHLDGDENWVISGDVTTSSVKSSVDLESVAVHEIGHLLGLGHSSVEDSIMYPTISSRTKKVELASDDIQGIQHLYGTNPDYNNNPSSSSTPSTQARETSDGGINSLAFRWVLSCLLAVGFCLLIL